MAADPNSNLHTDRGGCSTYMGRIKIDQDQVIRNPAYYVVAHTAKFVRPGSVRISFDMVGGFLNVAFKTPDIKRCLL